MKVHAAAFFALLIVGGLTFPVCAKDFKAQVPGWETMSDEDKAKTVREISRKNKLKKGEDKIFISDDKTIWFECVPCWAVGKPCGC